MVLERLARPVCRRNILIRKNIPANLLLTGMFDFPFISDTKDKNSLQ